MGSVAGAVPTSNSRRANRCVLPFRALSCASSMGCVINGRDAGCAALVSCANNADGNFVATATNAMAHTTPGERRQIALITSAPLLRHSYARGERTGIGGRKWPNPSRHAALECARGSSLFISTFRVLQYHSDSLDIPSHLPLICPVFCRPARRSCYFSGPNGILVCVEKRRDRLDEANSARGSCGIHFDRLLSGADLHCR